MLGALQAHDFREGEVDVDRLDILNGHDLQEARQAAGGIRVALHRHTSKIFVDH